MSSRRKKRRGAIGEAFVALEWSLINSEKWKSLPFSAQSLYIRLKQKYRGHNNGEIYLPYTELLDEFSRGTISRGFKILIKIGAIAVTKKGGLYREYCKYEIKQRWWINLKQIQVPFLNRDNTKNRPIASDKKVLQVQSLDLSKVEANSNQVQKIDPYLESAISRDI